MAIGDEVDVKVIKIDEKDVLMPSMKALLPRPPKPERDEKGEKSEASSPPTSSQGPQTKKRIYRNTERLRIRKRRNVWDGGAKPLIL